MIKFSRKFIFIIAVAAFLFNAAGIPLLVHLVEHKDDVHHDSDKCSICQQAVANKTKVILPTVSIVFELPPITIANTDAIDCFVKIFKFITPPLRAPPSAA
jgi:hypothetical protein